MSAITRPLARRAGTPTEPAALPRPRRAGRRGLGLVELLISLAITSALLTAVAVATAASARIVNETDAFTRAAQTARVTLNLILADCRRGTPIPGSITDTELNVLTAEQVDRTYVFDQANRQIIIINNDVPGDTGRPVAQNVIDCTFAATSTGSPLAVRRVTVNMTVQVGDNAIQLTGSAAPRQNASY